MSGAALIVGLGNPGSEYERTRHNLGYRVIDVLCDALGVRLRPLKGVRAFSGEGRDGERRVILARPTTYMNESGEGVAPCARYHKVGTEDLIVVHDDLDLAFGAVRVKRGGGDGGNNGVRSVARALGPDFARVRLGIGRPPGRQDPADFVLRPFPAAQEDDVGVMVREAADAALVVLRDGVEAAQNAHHGPRTDD